MIEFVEVDLGLKSLTIDTKIWPQPPSHQNPYLEMVFCYLKLEYLERFGREKVRLCTNEEDQQENCKNLIKGLKFLRFH